MRELENNVMRLLAPILGANKIRVVVNTDLDFDSTESEIVKYSDPVTRSEQLNVSGSDLETQEDDGNIGYNPSNVINEVNGEDATYNRTINNELTTEKSNTITAPGKVKKITASVIFDGTLSKQKTAEIENLVGGAIGYDFDRDDLINVAGIEFDPSEKADLDDQLDDFNSSEGLMGFVKDNKFIVIGVLAFLTILLLIFGIRKIFKKEDEEDFDFSGFDKSSEVLTEEIKNKKIVDDKGIDIGIDVDEVTAKDYAEEHPDLVADLVKVWMKDDE